MDMLAGAADDVRVDPLRVAMTGRSKLPDAFIASNGDQCPTYLRIQIFGEKLNMAIRKGRLSSASVSEFAVVSEIHHHLFAGVLRSHPVDGMFLSDFDHHQRF